MATITRSIDIARPPDVVFAFACEFAFDTRWRGGVSEMLVQPHGPCHVGTRTRETMRLAGVTLVTEGEVTAHEPGRRISFRSTSGPFPVRAHREVEPVDGGTRFTFRLEVVPRGPLSLLFPVMVGTFTRRLELDLERLKAAIESQVDPAQ